MRVLVGFAGNINIPSSKLWLLLSQYKLINLISRFGKYQTDLWHWDSELALIGIHKSVKHNYTLSYLLRLLEGPWSRQRFGAFEQVLRPEVYNRRKQDSDSSSSAWLSCQGHCNSHFPDIAVCLSISSLFCVHPIRHEMKVLKIDTKYRNDGPLLDIFVYIIFPSDCWEIVVRYHSVEMVYYSTS